MMAAISAYQSIYKSGPVKIWYHIEEHAAFTTYPLISLDPLKIEPRKMIGFISSIKRATKQARQKEICQSTPANQVSNLYWHFHRC
jgi:hypothetical protein